MPKDWLKLRNDQNYYRDLTRSNLQRTIYILETMGWCKHHQKLKTNVCLTEAIRRASLFVDKTYVWSVVNYTYFAVHDAMMRHNHTQFETISAFNDDGRTTLQDVLTVLTTALHLSEEIVE